MPLLAWILLFSLVGGAFSVLAAALFLLIPERQRTHVLPHAVSFAIGALLGAAFLGLLPHAIENDAGVGVHPITLTVVAGILLFFLLEKFVLWRHCHSSHCEVHGVEHQHKAAGYLILIGDGFHNFVDGILIAAAFLTDVHLGIITALAVTAHEVPQEVGDFAILLHSGFSRGRALLYNVLSSLTTVAGALLAYFALAQIAHIMPYVLAFAAASFIYIAMADLIPELHKRTQARATVQQIVLICAGLSVILLAHALLHH